MDIRKYRDSDFGRLVELWKEVFPDDPPHNAPDKAIHAKLEVDDLIFVVELQGQIVGACMAGYDGHRGWLYMVGVHPDFRRRKIGEALVRYAIDHLGKIGCSKVNLQIRAGNNKVAEFYRSLGFATEERISMGIHL